MWWLPGTWLLALALLPSQTSGECCNSFAAEICCDAVVPVESVLCNDGKFRTGFYCGKGPCNVFGCNCDGGCITGLTFSVPRRPKLFLCSTGDPTITDFISLDSLLVHPNCSCVLDAYGDRVIVNIEESTGARERLGPHLVCLQGMESCTMEVTTVKQYSVTTSVNGGISIGTESIPIGFEASVGRDWSDTTGNETSFQCQVKENTTTYLAAEPEFYKVTEVIMDRHDGERTRCSKQETLVPRTESDGSIKGRRFCVSEKHVIMIGQ